MKIAGSHPQILIATLLHEHGPTGVQAHFNALEQYLRERGVPVRVITPFHFPRTVVYPVFGMRRIIDILNGSASVWWYRYWHYLFLKHALRNLLKDGKSAIVYAQCPLAAKAALEARQPGVQRVVMVAHFNISQADEWAEKGKIPHNGIMFRGIQQMERELLPRLDGIVYVSRFIQGQLEARVKGLQRVRAAVIPNFVYPPIETPSDEVRADLINIGTLEPRKNQHYLLNVLRCVNQLGRRYTLTLVGDGPDRPSLEQAVRQYGLAEQVHFLGARKNAASLIKYHRIYAHSATMESFGIVLIEALAAGVPVIAPRVGGISEVFRDTEGMSWPLDAPEEGAHRLIDLLEQPERLKRMSNAARQRYLDAYTPNIAANRLYEFLCDIHNRRGLAV